MYNTSLSDLQINLLDMMKWFDNFCRANGLRYYAIGGTMIGAVRHKGFIPWDDDIDVGMPRNDYNRMKQILGNQIHGHYLLETPQSDEDGYSYPYSKLYDTNTTLIEHGKKPIKRGTFIDIFQIDGLADSEKDAKILYLKYRKKYNFYVSRITAIRKGRSFAKNLAVIIARLMPFVDDKKLRMDLESPAGIKDFDSSLWVGYLYGNYGVREIMPQKVYGSPVDYEFEDMKIMGVTDYDTYLTRVYGNWREMPPKEKQVTHHDFLFFDLNKSYLLE